MKTSNQEMNPLHGVSPQDAIGMLIADHKRVANLFADFKRLIAEGRDKEKAPIVEQICQELTIHAQLEEEVFYPAVREATKDDDMMNEALVEHAGAKQLIVQLQRASPADELYDAKVTVLGEQIDHHVEEEEGSMFPKARYSGLDMLKLGATMLARKSELQNGAPQRVTPAMHDDGVDGEDAQPPKPRAQAKKKSPRADSSPANSSRRKNR